MAEHDNDRALKTFFDAARTEAPQPSADLMARILADAAEEQARQTAAAMPAPKPHVPRWRQLFATVGGWPAMAALAVATVAGVWIGANPPQGIENTALALLGDTGSYAMVDLMPGSEFDLGEGAL